MASTSVRRADIVLTGTLEEGEEYFRTHGLTDGTAFTPPTLAKVEAFLEYTDLAPDHNLGVMRPANIPATPLNIAANGVMAGCRPEHMPVLLAAAEALLDGRFNLEQLGTTIGRHPFLVLNGPIVHELGIEYETSAISRGPNPALGRALGLIVRNIAGFRPGEQYLGTYGYFTPFVLAENEKSLAEIGWAPINVNAGFAPGTSTVALADTLNYGAQSHETSGTNVEDILHMIALEIVREVNTAMMLYWADAHMTTVIMTPCQAEEIAAAGYSRQDVEAFLFEHATTTLDEIQFILKAGHGGGTSTDLKALIDAGLTKAPPEWLDFGPKDPIPAMCFPDQIRVVVAGNPTRSNAMVLYGVYTPGFTFREITLPARWNELREPDRQGERQP